MLKKDIDFLVEIDKMKTTLRKTRIIGEKEFEDDAQHSWHVAMMAVTLKEYSDVEINLERVIQMLLIHDLVEIYAGDTYGYDEEGHKDKLEREIKSANKLFSILDKDKEEYFKSLWEEFEKAETNDAKFAFALDRLHPIITNYNNNGGTWKEHKITSDKIKARALPIKEASETLWNYANSLVDKVEEKGYLS